MNTYILLIIVDEALTTTVGSLGEVEFSEGIYAYVGSARSSNFSRLSRHHDVASGHNDTRHWHIDYLTGPSKSEIVGAYTTTNLAECQVAQKLTEFPAVEQFGCSDCDCASHLYFISPDVSTAKGMIRSAISSDSLNFEVAESFA